MEQGLQLLFSCGFKLLVMKLIPFTAFFVFDGVDIVGKFPTTLLTLKGSAVFMFVVVNK